MTSAPPGPASDNIVPERIVIPALVELSKQERRGNGWQWNTPKPYVALNAIIFYAAISIELSPIRAWGKKPTEI